MKKYKMSKWKVGRYGGYAIWDVDEPGETIADFPAIDYGGMIKARKHAEKELKKLSNR